MAANWRQSAGELARWNRARLALSLVALLCLASGWLFPPLYAAIGLATLLVVALTLISPTAGLCLLAWSVPWASGLAVPLGSFPVTLTDIIVAATAVSWLLRPGPKAATLRQLAWLPYVVLFIAAMAVSTQAAADWHASVREIVKWLELSVVYVATASSVWRMWQLRVLVASLVLAGVSQAVLGYAQFLFQLGPAAFAHGVFLRAYGSFDQPNPYAGYLNMVLPLALALGVGSQSSRERAAYRVAAVCLVGALLASESRGALLATVVAATVVLGSSYSRTVRNGALWATFALLGGSWLATFNLVPLGPFQWLLSVVGLGEVSFGNVTDANFSAVERAAHWLAGVRMFAAHPLLGVGIGNYAVAYPAYHPRGWYAALAHAHNYYINIAAEAGIVGLSAYLLFAGSALWYSYAACRQVSSAYCRAVVVGVLGALVATDFHNLFDVLYVHGLVAILGLLVGLVPGTLQLDKRAQGAGDGHPA